MSSSIYYPERKLYQNVGTPPPSGGFFSKLFGGPKAEEPPPPFKSAVITAQSVKKLLGLPNPAVSINMDEARFHQFAFQPVEGECTIPELGKVFVPQSIHMTDGTEDYFIVMIDGELEVRRWPGFRLDMDHPDKMKSYPLKDRGVMQALEKSFSLLMETTGVNKAYEDRFKNVRPTLLDKEELDALLEIICPGCDPDLSSDVYNAALNPLPFYKTNSLRLQALGCQGPYEGMYMLLLLDGLKQRKVLQVLPKDASMAEIGEVISGLSQGRYAGIFTERDTGNAELATGTLLKLACGRLLNKGAALMFLENAPQGYNVTLVKSDAVQKAADLAAKCGLTMGALLV